MASDATKQLANRFGLDIRLHTIADEAVAVPLIVVDFANISSIDLSGDRSWATGGQPRFRRIGFDDGVKGSFTLSTQLMTTELLNAIANGRIAPGTQNVVFQNDLRMPITHYQIKADTVWQDMDGATCSERLTFHNACPHAALNITYNGVGDPVSADIEFELLQGASGDVMTVSHDAPTETLSAPTIAINGLVLQITNGDENTSAVDIYDNDILIGTASIGSIPASINLGNIPSCITPDDHTIQIVAQADGFFASAKSNAVTYAISVVADNLFAGDTVYVNG